MEPRFNIGDQVTVKGYGGVYEIVGYMISKLCHGYSCDEEIEYDLVRVGVVTSNMISACEDDLTLVRSAQYLTIGINPILFDVDKRSLYVNSDTSRYVRRDYANMTPEELIEMYADYMALDRAFGGRVYKRRADAILTELRKRKEAV